MGLTLSTPGLVSFMLHSRNVALHNFYSTCKYDENKAKSILTLFPFQVPYVALAVWNEDLRLEMRAKLPMDFKHDVEYGREIRYEVNSLIKTCGGDPERGGTTRVRSRSSVREEPAPTQSSSSSRPSQRPIPKDVGTVTRDVKFFDEHKMCLLNGGLQNVMNNCIGKVDQILTEHLAILSFHQGTKKIRVLCSSEDTFILDIKDRFHQFKDFKMNNKLKFDKSQEVWSLSAKKLRKSLFEVLKIDQKIVFNAVALVSNPETNNANISYVTAGVVVTRTTQTSVSVPLVSLSSGTGLSDDFKMYFMKIIRSVDIQGQFEKGSFTVYHPAKFQESQIDGRREKMHLRIEYNANEAASVSNISRCLPTPVSVKKPPPKPIVWEPIINLKYGRVIKVIDKNYGLGASFVPRDEGSRTCETFQFLFDIYDIYVGDLDCSELGRRLPEVTSPGDYMLFNAVKVSS